MSAADDYPWLALRTRNLSGAHYAGPVESKRALAEIDRLRAIEAAARYFMTAPNRTVEENAHSVLYCALKLCGGNCRDCADEVTP